MSVKYDFESYVDRSKTGSSKWNQMREANPDTPEGIVPLSVADMELKNAPEIITGLREFLNIDTVSLGYTTSTEAYDSAVKSWIKRRHGWDVDMNWNVLSPGIVTALFHAVRAFSEPGDGIIILSPVYYPFMMAVDVNNRTLVDVPLIIGEKHYEIDWIALEAAAGEQRNKLLIFCSPHNPVGRVWTPEELGRVAEICLKNNVLVLSDEIHNDLIMPGYSHTAYPLISKDAENNCIMCTSPSKTFSIAGLQVSNIFVPNEDIRKRFRHEMMSSAQMSLGTIAYKACELAYNNCEEWLNQVIALIAKNADLTVKYLAEHIPQIKVYPLEGTYLQWWDCNALFDDYNEMEDFMKKKALLFFDEGYIFGDAGRGFERINLACPTWVLTDALERLKAALDAR